MSKTAKSFYSRVLKFTSTYSIELLLGGIFFLLLFRAPFSTRTLIPNFEPYPDSFHYLIPAMHLIEGEGMTMNRVGKILPGVPPLYSLCIAPFLLIVNDPRMAYFTNLFLSMLSFTFFALSIKKLFPSKLIRFLTLLLFVTHPVLTWYVELVMAEHVTLMLTTLGLWLVLRSGRKLLHLSQGLLAPLLYASKYAAAPVSFAFTLIFFIKSVRETRRTRSFTPVLFFCIGLLVSASIYLTINYSIRQTSELHTVLNVVTSKLSPPPTVSTESGEPQPPTDPFFGPRYIKHNLTAYGNYLLGHQLTILWRNEQLLAAPFVLLGTLGWLLAFASRHKLFATTIILQVVSTLAFLSIFYVVDGRYVYHFIPLSILGVGFSLQFFYSLCKKPQHTAIVSLLILLLIGFYSITNAKDLKFRFSLNLRHSETPWYYLAAKEVDSYLAANGSYDKTPVIISPMPPFLFDFYAKEKMLLLPLHRYQEFRNATTQTWGDYDFSDLHGVYKNFLEDGHPVFLTHYGVGNEGYLQQEFESVKTEFNGELVFEGCHNLCNIYKLRISK